MNQYPNITKLIEAAINHTGEPVSILVEWLDDEWGVTIVDVSSNETMTRPDDWKVDLAVNASTLDEAMAALEAECALINWEII